MEFSVAEINFICIVKGENRKDTINNTLIRKTNPQKNLPNGQKI